MIININLTEKEIFSIIEIVSRKEELLEPHLMYEKYLSSVVNKIYNKVNEESEAQNE